MPQQDDRIYRIRPPSQVVDEVRSHKQVDSHTSAHLEVQLAFGGWGWEAHTIHLSFTFTFTFKFTFTFTSAHLIVNVSISPALQVWDRVVPQHLPILAQVGLIAGRSIQDAFFLARAGTPEPIRIFIGATLCMSEK
jgi:hypothetical protein